MPHRNATMEPLPPWETEKLFLTAADWFDQVLRDVGGAQYRIELQTYIFQLDAIGRPLLDALCAASARGVVVRVLVDGIGSSEALDVLQQRLVSQGAELHVFNPLPWRWAAAQSEPGDWFSRFTSRWAKLNNRQHSKLCLVDNAIAWVGSYNVTASHLSQAGRNNNWKDAGVRVTGSRCILLREFFDAVWFHDVEKLSVHFLLHPLTNFSPALRKRRLRVLLISLNAAQERIWISSAYFSPVPQIVRALKNASARGVDVRILVSERSDVSFFPALSNTYYADLLNAGIHLHVCEDVILHTKHLLIDSQVVIGSSNMNHRSVLHDVELDVEVFSPAVLQAVEEDFIQNFQQNTEVTVERVNRLSMWLLMLGHIPRLLRYWL